MVIQDEQCGPRPQGDWDVVRELERSTEAVEYIFLQLFQL